MKRLQERITKTEDCTDCAAPVPDPPMTLSYRFHFRPAPGIPFDPVAAMAALDAQRPLAHLPERRWKLPWGEVAVIVPRDGDESLVWFRLPPSSPAQHLEALVSELAPISVKLRSPLARRGDGVDLLLEKRRAEGLYLVSTTMEALAARHPLEHLPERSWRLDAGAVPVCPVVEEGKARALELCVPLSDLTRTIEQVLRHAAAAAQASGLLLWDLQLGRAVDVSDEPAVVRQFLQLARFSGDVLGTPGLAGMAEEPSRRSSVWRWIWLALGVAALLRLLRALFGAG